MPRVSLGPGGGTVLRALDQFVVKLHSRCNLACDYCYVYELRDTGWRGRPRTMPSAVRDRLVLRIAEHARRHRLRRIRVILHGGEPLLAGEEVIAGFAESVRHALAGTETEVRLAVQSNGLLLDEAMLEVLLRHDVRVGLSLDGDQEAHNRHRRRRPRRSGDGRGAGSHQETVRALARLGRPRYAGLFEGLLCTVDTANDPVRTYDALVSHRPPAIDFLLPDGTWDHPPPGTTGGTAPYGAWLAAAFDRWWQTGRPVHVRLFEAVISLCRYGGGSGGSELVGTLPAAAAVIESDGTVAWTDSLKAVADGAGNTGGNVFSHSFDEILALPEVPEYGTGSLCRTCLMCPLVDICGGGIRAHRYGRGNGFGNPSVYCRDLSLLIRHIRTRLDEGSPHPSVRRDRGGDQHGQASPLALSDEVRPNDVFPGRVEANLAYTRPEVAASHKDLRDVLRDIEPSPMRTDRTGRP
ncbi:FxsB family cyclophane-forming radical SAM/SPASM peptide maturase [Streptomyces sp. AK02-01A]|uniref:FxsB family cyclophane-forming radical SAM/SPASM peptide maturase n=1 Tax=Streptomyces sp. AK02-01A TaxID=3028648 RepID=UPI0029AE5E82|nr:FxsB family cyclophane-forming radical SAM/SPASM peptide maturase [Streptomyces sp. AK02-01A]MDX3850529.1 FxsB family radical SAM/SPASM domain protein [Streptomyces sp. AK02-01A]